jgi:CubicO group peptidase (beta-lactamase class C family)
VSNQDLKRFKLYFGEYLHHKSHTIMKKIITLITVLYSFAVYSQNEQIEKIDAIINAKVEENHPGIMVGIVKDGNIIYERYRGLANLQYEIKVNEKTRSNIASTAKQFTALMILDLALKNKLSLEDDIRKYLPNLYKNVAEEIKIRHLINHTSGIRDYVELMSLNGPVWWKRFGLDNDDVMELIEKQEDLGFKPGSTYSYSNSNYNVLTKVIEKVTDEKFTKYSKDFFKDLGMNETSFIERYMRVIPNRADPYSDWGRGEWWETPTVTKTNGEGFLFTTLKDQLIYEQAVQNATRDNNQLLIQSQQPIPNSEIKTYGFGLKLEDQLNRKAVHHDGVTYSYHSQTIRFTEENLTVFIMSNNGNIRSDLIAKEIASVFLPKLEKKVQYDPRLNERISSTKNPKIIDQYRYPDGEILVRIVEEEGKTYWKEGNYYKLEMVSEGKNKFSFKNDPKLKVVFYENEMVEYYASGKTMNYKRNQDVPASSTAIEGFAGTYYNTELEIGFEMQLTEGNTLRFMLSDSDETENVQVFNKNDLLAGNSYKMRVQRDAFDRVTAVLLSFGRAKNMRFTKKTNLKYQPKIPTENGSIQVTTIGSRDNSSSQILLTKNYPNGNEIWYKKFGGKSYDKANSILDTEDGYLIIGSTSSYGNGNYDMFVIKTDKEGKKQWQHTYGDFYNEYGYSAEKTTSGYLIKGTKQNCENNTDINRKCTSNVWFVSIDKEGNELSSELLEKIE